VLIVKGSSVGGAKRSGKMDKILVPVDFSRCSLQGLKYAIQVADRFAARISVLNAVYLGYAYTADGFAMYDLSALEKAAREIAEREMVRFVHAAKFGSVKFETAVTIGPPLDHICASAKNKDIDLIITSTHGYTGFKHVLIGSTAEQIVRRAPCSVLVVPSHPAVRATPLTGQTRKALRLIRVLAPRVTQRKTIASEQFTKKYRKGASHPAPERRQINKFRESHPVRR
jgi:nucleotide-binding universal stress UspA family protein